MDNTSLIITIISLVLALVSLAAIVLSFISYKESSKTTLKVNSKEHEMSESMKSELLELVAILRFIDRKAASVDYFQRRHDFSYEIDRLSKIQMSPSYLIYLHSTGLETVDDNINCLLELLLMNESEMMNNIRFWIRVILKELGEYTNIKDGEKVNFEKLLKKWCTKKCCFVVPDLNYSVKKMKELLKDKAFMEKLKDEGNNDGDVDYIHKVLCTAIDENAIEIGWNVNCWVTKKDVLQKYQEEYKEFLKTYQDGN